MFWNEWLYAFKYFTEERAQEPGGVDMSNMDLFLFSIQIFLIYDVDYDWNEWLYAFKYFTKQLTQC